MEKGCNHICLSFTGMWNLYSHTTVLHLEEETQEGKKRTKDRGLDQDESFITSVLLAFSRTSTEEGAEMTEMAKGSCEQHSSYLCPKHAVRPHPVWAITYWTFILWQLLC